MGEENVKKRQTVLTYRSIELFRLLFLTLHNRIVSLAIFDMDILCGDRDTTILLMYDQSQNKIIIIILMHEKCIVNCSRSPDIRILCRENLKISFML